MCGLCRRKCDKQAIATAFRIESNIEDVILPPDDDIRPTAMQPIIRVNRDTGKRDLVMARCGFVHS